MYAWDDTKTIAEDVERLEQLRVTLDHQGPLPRRWHGRLRRDLEAEAVAASTSMEGVPVTVEEVRRILAGDRPASVSSEDTAFVEGYRDAMNYVLRRADDSGFEWQTELILGIHDRVLAGSYAAGAGRYRERQVYLADSSKGRQVYEPPSPEEVPVLVDELAAFAGASGSIAAPVLSALVHVRFAGIHPFADGNGRTARVLASLVMYRNGYKRQEFTSLEEWWGSHLTDYYRAFDCLGERWDPDADVTPFVEAHVRAQRLQVDALSLRQAVERRIWTALEDIATEDLGGQPRLADALYDAFFGREVTNRYYRGLTDVSVATATNDLSQLEASGLLRAQGAGRSRSYVGTRRLIESVADVAGLSERLPDPAVPLEEARGVVTAGLAERYDPDFARYERWE
jgi:Fic family protein